MARATQSAKRRSRKPVDSSSSAGRVTASAGAVKTGATPAETQETRARMKDTNKDKNKEAKVKSKPEAKSKPKPKADKVVRDSFTMPAADYALIGLLKKRCLGLGTERKKSELLRAGLLVLHALPDQAFGQAVAQIDSVKTGRPPKEKKKDKRGKTQ